MSVALACAMLLAGFMFLSSEWEIPTTGLKQLHRKIYNLRCLKQLPIFSPSLSYRASLVPSWSSSQEGVMILGYLFARTCKLFL